MSQFTRDLVLREFRGAQVKKDTLYIDDANYNLIWGVGNNYTWLGGGSCHWVDVPPLWDSHLGLCLGPVPSQVPTDLCDYVRGQSLPGCRYIILISLYLVG